MRCEWCNSPLGDKLFWCNSTCELMAWYVACSKDKEEQCDQ